MTDIEVPRTKVEVTQEDIDKGIPSDCNNCAIYQRCDRLRGVDRD